MSKIPTFGRHSSPSNNLKNSLSVYIPTAMSRVTCLNRNCQLTLEHFGGLVDENHDIRQRAISLLLLKDYHNFYLHFGRAIEHPTYSALTRPLCELSSLVPPQALAPNKKLRVWAVLLSFSYETSIGILVLGLWWFSNKKFDIFESDSGKCLILDSLIRLWYILSNVMLSLLIQDTSKQIR